MDLTSLFGYVQWPELIIIMIIALIVWVPLIVVAAVVVYFVVASKRGKSKNLASENQLPPESAQENPKST